MADVIREVRPDDADAIAAVHVAAWHVAYRGIVPDAMLDAFTLASRQARWRENLAHTPTGVRTTVLERDGRVVAFASGGPSRDEPGAGEIWALYVHPDAWRAGAGRSLLLDTLGHLRAQGYRVITLWVLEGNTRAIGFYESMGFALDGVRKVEHGMPHLHMRVIYPEG